MSVLSLSVEATQSQDRSEHVHLLFEAKFSDDARQDRCDYVSSVQEIMTFARGVTCSLM